jgi:hypothetical protein
METERLDGRLRYYAHIKSLHDALQDARERSEVKERCAMDFVLGAKSKELDLLALEIAMECAEIKKREDSNAAH